jgi:hypothetical protein
MAQAEERVAVLELDVVSWRFDCLVRSGYPVDLAVLLAEMASVDLHDAVELVKRGCPVEQAVEILV